MELRRLAPLAFSFGDIALRPWQGGDDIVELTQLLRRAYKRLADMGLRFTATWQDDAITARRIARGECWIGLRDGRTVATATLYPTGSNDGTPHYRQPGVAVFGQFGVEPALQGMKLGGALMDIMELRARETGATDLALDTSEKAHHLIAWYLRRGYALVETVQWEEVNYRSVIMSKSLVGA